MDELVIREGILCKLCLSVALDKELCACKNLGVLIDHDGHLHLYVEDILTTQRAALYLHKGKEVRREIQQSFQEAIYANYDFQDEPYTFRPKAPKSYRPKKTSTSYDTSFMNYLDRHILKTSDGKEDFQRNATLNPKRITT